MKIAICSDHAGFDLKSKVIEYLKTNGINELNDFGAYSSESSDYPDFGHPMAASIQQGDSNLGISICGSGNGISMTLNKHKGIRAALCWMPEIASLARKHNNANVLSLPARFVSYPEAVEIIDAFFNAEYEGGRHQRRIEKIENAYQE